MDVTTVLKEVEAWPVEDRIRLMNAVWDGLEPELTETQAAELDRRVAELEAHPVMGVPWEEVERSVRRGR